MKMYYFFSLVILIQSLINYAIAKSYYVANFLVSPLQFGYYSSEPKVKTGF